MIKRMVENLESRQEDPMTPEITNDGATSDNKANPQFCWRQMDCLLPGTKPRIYKPLLERHTCGKNSSQLEDEM